MSETGPPATRNELVRLINDSWRSLNEVVASVPADKFVAEGPEGWSVKDHLAHMAAWERMAVAAVRGEPEEAAAGLEPWVGDWDTDRFNDLLYEKWAESDPAEVSSFFEQSHAEMMDLIAGLDDASLRADMPNEPGRAKVDKIVGNTYHHFDEHRGWIQQLTASI